MTGHSVVWSVIWVSQCVMLQTAEHTVYNNRVFFIASSQREDLSDIPLASCVRQTNNGAHLLY